MPAAPSPALRKLFADLEALFQTETEERVSTSVLAAERALAEHLNQAVRRLRQVMGFGEMAAILCDASAPFCNGCAVFTVTENTVTGECVRGAESEAAGHIRNVSFAASEGAAFASAIDSREPVVTVCLPSQVPDAVAKLFPGAAGARAFLFPIIAKQTAGGLLYAVGVPESAPIELLSQSAGVALEAQRPKVPEKAAAPPDLVRIEPAPAPKKSGGPDWDLLNAADRSLHLRAQRFARVQVAEIRLYQAAAVESGRSRGDLYSALQDAIDTGREAFRQNFVSASQNMVDYFHQELVRTLANDNPATLGEKYPGLLV
jgi:hypothetical protein